MDPTEQLIAAIEAFLERSGMTATAFGLKSSNDPNLVGDLRAGRECRRQTIQRLHAFIRAQEQVEHERMAS